MAGTKASGYQTFDQISSRLDEIIALVRDKDTSLERSFDLFDEALSLGATAVELVDATNFAPEEEARLEGLSREIDQGDASIAGGGSADGAAAQA